jgi:hypothetical protein
MPKQRKRDGVYWRKDRRIYWISYVDAHGNRQRRPGAKSWEEARQVLAETLSRVKEEGNLKPGEVLECRESFADVAGRFLAYQKPRLTPKAYQREEGIAAHLKAFFTGRLANVTSSQVSDYVTARLGKVISVSSGGTSADRRGH